MGKVVTIHQPDLMPWLGFFVKVSRADTYIVLDSVSNNIKDSSWFRRVRILNSKTPCWLSIPIEKGALGSIQVIREMRVADSPQSQKLFEKYLKGFEQNYSNAPFYERYKHLFVDYFKGSHLLCQRNYDFIRAVMRLLSIETEVVFSSELDVLGSGNELNLALVKTVGGSRYLSGDGAGGYQDINLFKREKIDVCFNEYKPLAYPQVGTQDPILGLSVIDAS